MQITDIAKQVLDSIEQCKAASTGSLYTDDFRFTGAVPMPLDRDQYVEVMNKVCKGVPDWKFNYHDIHVDGQTVVVPVQVTGTHTRTLPGLMPGMPDLPATNRSFRLPPEEIKVTFRGDRISNVHVDPVPGGGVQGMLEQLGVAIPVTGKPSDQQKK
jgi:hypothetical protein